MQPLSSKVNRGSKFIKFLLILDKSLSGGRRSAVCEALALFTLGLTIFAQGCAPALLAGGGAGSLIAAKQVYGRDKSIGQFVDDVLTQGRLNSRFNEDNIVDFSKIEIKVEKGIVTLSGELEEQRQIDRAIELARTTDGVLDVKSELILKKSPAK